MALMAGSIKTDSTKTQFDQSNKSTALRNLAKWSRLIPVGALLITNLTFYGCATSGYKIPKSYIKNNLGGSFNQSGSVSSPTGSAKYGVSGNGENIVVVTDGKKGTSYTSERKIKKIKYNKKTGQYKVYYTDGTVEYLSTSPK